MSLYQQQFPHVFETDSSIHHKIRRIKNQQLFKRTQQSLFNQLTLREREIISLVARDYNNPKIAELLSISRATVAQHRKNINRKLSIESFGQLYYYALAFDLV